MKCSAAFKPVNSIQRRVLTNPSEGVGNGGIDNEEANLICRVYDTILNSTAAAQLVTSTYTVLDLLGTGTFGQVFRCQRQDTKEIAAVKVIKNKTAYNTQGQVEINILKHLNSKTDPNDSTGSNIVRMLETFDYKGHICIVFELLDISLLDILTQNQYRGLPLKVVQRFTQQIMATLVALQQANVIHCDLKPENILLTPTSGKSGKPKKLSSFDM